MGNHLTIGKELGKATSVYGYQCKKCGRRIIQCPNGRHYTLRFFYGLTIYGDSKRTIDEVRIEICTNIEIIDYVENSQKDVHISSPLTISTINPWPVSNLSSKETIPLSGEFRAQMLCTPKVQSPRC